MERLRYLTCLLPLLVLSLLAAAAPLARAGDVLQEVPRDALGFAVVRNLSVADAKAGKALGALGSRLPGPLALLKSIAGLDAGLDHERDLMVVLLPPQNNAEQFHLAIWLPVSDYDALVRSLDGDPQRRIAPVTLAGEDLLVVRDSDWAVVMDIDQRDRLEQMRDGKSQPSPPPQLDQWAKWIAENDVTVVVLPAGKRAAWARAVEEGLFDAAHVTAPPKATNDDLFGPATGSTPAGAGWPTIRQWIQTTFADAPELARWAAEAEGAACGLRLDDAGNALVGVRLAFSPDVLQQANLGDKPDATGAAPTLYVGGPFVVVGSGQVSPRWAVPAVAPYVRRVSADLATQFGSKVDDADVAEFRQGVERAVAEVSAFSLLTRPGAGADGVFTNNFLALRVNSAPKFLELAGQLVATWNKMVGKSDSSKLLVLHSESIDIADHKGTEHSIDMSNPLGGPIIPEVKATMEKLFGPGGKFRLQFVEVDPQTVILAAATLDQVAATIGVVKSNAPSKDPDELREPARLLSAGSQWRVFASPHGYSEWQRRQMDAILGAVIGGPVVPQFPESPPLGFGGGVEARSIWAEVAVPVDTLRGYSKYSRK